MSESILAEGIQGALKLIFSGEQRVYSAAFTSVWVASISTTAAFLLGMPLAFLLAFNRFPGRQAVITLLNTLLALPTVVVGLFVYALIRRGSWLGPLDLLFSPSAMIIGQVVLAVPIVTALGHAALAAGGKTARETAISLGASPVRAAATTAWETRFGLMAALAAAGGRLISEVGVSLMLGGNIAGYTRSLTTAIALETSKGEFAFAFALGIILVMLALVVNFLLRYAQGKGEEAA
ncbi:MAG TPA: ABC transporter permease [Planctomycetes bacterium]|nr:ABC transporter permease [Planctomycetota bacterium]